MELYNSQKWENCLKVIQDNIPAEQFDAWFKPVSFVRFENGALELFVPSQFFAEQLEERYFRLIATTIQKYFGVGTKLYYCFNQIGNRPDTEVKIGSSNASQAVKPRAGVTSNPFRNEKLDDIDPQLNPRYNFENYCESDSNKVARTIAQAIAENPMRKTYNPLFVFGASGVGKTHLIQAIGIRIKELYPENRVLYITARLFESQYTAALCHGKINDFIRFYQSVDTLIIDDIQDLVGKTKTQMNFFHIFNHLHQNNKQIIMSSDCRPSMLEGMEERMLSRFKWGMTVELQRPDFKLRHDFLVKKSEQDGLNISDEIIDYIASNVTSSIRELEGVVVSLIAHAAILNKEVDIDLTKMVVANAVKIRSKQVNFDSIANEVCGYYGIQVDDIFTVTRKREISDTRQIVMYLAKKIGNMQLSTIGARLSRTHATVLHACRNIEQRLSVEAQLQNEIAEIENSLLH